jgi:hypothetical protein
VNRGIVAAVLAAATTLGCSGPTEVPSGHAPQAQTPPKQPLDPRRPGASIVCGSSLGPDGRPEVEMYMLYAMNRKLREFPDFASAMGTDLVSDCDGARHYVVTYRDYVKSNPGFDTTESLGDLPTEGPLPEEAEAPSGGDVQKVLNGQTVASNPVVKFAMGIPATAHSDWGFEFDGQGTHCTGTFINKNWILTAAHCLTLGAVYKCLKDGTAPLDCVPEWENYNTPYSLSGTKGPTTSANWGFVARAIRGYVHPNWIGGNLNMNPETCNEPGCVPFPQMGKWDLGLLYVPSHFYDDKLPPNIEENGALRLSVDQNPDVANWPTLFYGYGAPTPYALRKGSMVMQSEATLRQDPDWSEYADYVFRGVLPPVGTGTDVKACGGDSGGPLVRTGLTLETNQGQRVGREVIIGVTSFTTKGCSIPTGPVSRSLVHSAWARVDDPVARGFIEGTMQKSNWPPYTKLDCTERAIVSAPNDPKVLECWGKTCKVDADCKDNSGVKKVCSFSGRYFGPRQQSCMACDASGGGCDCIYGQCAPAP